MTNYKSHKKQVWSQNWSILLECGINLYLGQAWFYFVLLNNFFPIKACTGQKRVKEAQGGGSASKKQKRSHKATVVNNKKKGKGSKCEISKFLKYKDNGGYVFSPLRKGYSGYGTVNILISSLTNRPPPPPVKSHRSLLILGKF